MPSAVLDDLPVYAGMATATLVLIALIVLPANAKAKGESSSVLARIPSVGVDRARVSAVAFAAAFLVFVAIDLLSGRAITQFAGNTLVTGVAVTVVLAALAFDVIVLVRRH